MIEKIKNLIEDNTTMDVTHKQVILMLSIVGALLILIIIIMFGAGGPSEDDKNYIPAPSNQSEF